MRAAQRRRGRIKKRESLSIRTASSSATWVGGAADSINTAVNYHNHTNNNDKDKTTCTCARASQTNFHSAKGSGEN